MNKLKDQNLILAEDLVIGDGSSSPVSTATASKYCGTTEGILRLEARAKTAITIATGKAFNVEVLTGASGAEAAPVAGGHQYLWHKTAADDEKVFAAGDLIGAMVLPAEYGPNVKTVIYSDSDHSAAKVDVILYPVA